MLNNIQGRGLVKKHSVTVRPYPGTTMRDTLEPELHGIGSQGHIRYKFCSDIVVVSKTETETVNDLIETETLKMVYKSKNQLAPEYLNSMFIKLSEFRNRQLRDSDTDLYVPLLKSACGQKSFSYGGAKLWTSQQTEVKKAKSFTQFVKSLKNHRP